MANKKKLTAMVINVHEVYLYFYERIVNIALSQFVWDGLPETCNRRYMEWCALMNGAAAMSQPVGIPGKWLSTGFLPTSKSIPGRVMREILNKGTAEDITHRLAVESEEVAGRFPDNVTLQIKEQTGNVTRFLSAHATYDVYGDPNHIRGIGFNGEQWDTETWCIFYDNMTKTSLMPKIELYAKMLTEIWCTMRNNVRQQNTPYIVQVPKQCSFSVKEFFRAIFTFEPVIEVNQALTDSITKLDLGANLIAPELMNLMRDVWQECLSTLGISAKQDKKERMITSEAALNRQADIVELSSRLLNRIEFCEKMNNLYGLNLSVKMSSNIPQIDDILGIGGDMYGDLYSDSIGSVAEGESGSES